jgi:hypothetical protein
VVAVAFVVVGVVVGACVVVGARVVVVTAVVLRATVVVVTLVLVATLNERGLSSRIASAMPRPPNPTMTSTAMIRIRTGVSEARI